MTLHEFSILWSAGLPIWIVTMGGLLCLSIDALASRKSYFLVYGTGVGVTALALYVAFRQWVTHVSFKQDLLLNDSLTQFFVFLVLGIGLLSLLNTYSYLGLVSSSSASNEPSLVDPVLPGAVVTLVLFSLVGMIFLFASDHLMVNFIGLETMSLALYILVGSRKKDLRSNEAAMKYYVLGSVASAILLFGIALIYASFSTFRLSELGDMTPNLPEILFPQMGVLFILVGILFKLSLVPFHFWVPDVYEGAPAPITGFMATSVKAAAFALLIRVLVTLNFLPTVTVTKILLVCVVLTLVVGNLGAIVQDNVKRMLAYSSIAHAGYLLLGLFVGYQNGKFDAETSSAVIFYLLGYSVMTLGAFAVLSLMIEKDKEVTQYSDLVGLGFQRPVVAALFSLFLVSLLGLPPTVGFVAKFNILSFAVKNGYVSLAILGVLTSLISAYYYLKPLVMMYFKGDAVSSKMKEVPLPLMLVLTFLAVSVLLLGVWPMEYLHMASLAAQALK